METNQEKGLNYEIQIKNYIINQLKNLHIYGMIHRKLY